jgi:hypothetical protein
MCPGLIKHHHKLGRIRHKHEIYIGVPVLTAKVLSLPLNPTSGKTHKTFPTKVKDPFAMA